VAHAMAKLTPLGRAALVERVLVDGWPVVRAAEAMNVSRQTAHKWVRRFREEGPAGLVDRSSIARRHPHELSARYVERILRARRKTKHGPHRLAYALGCPRSTVYGVLRRHGMHRLDWMDRPTGRVIRRYERSRPGELVHIDVKKLGRIPDGGGWRLLGRSTEARRNQRRTWREGRLGYDYLHAAIDDHSRLAYVEVHPDERAASTSGFLHRASAFFSSHGIRVEAVMTDNAWTYTHARTFREALGELGARHLVIPPRRPQVNGKVERFNRTMLEEWAYVRLYRSNDARTKALSRWVDFYNAARPHTALGGRPPMARVNNGDGNYT
jgi:transposase InsO family protein